MRYNLEARWLLKRNRIFICAILSTASAPDFIYALRTSISLTRFLEDGNEAMSDRDLGRPIY